jgi:hypothetical protein
MRRLCNLSFSVLLCTSAIYAQSVLLNKLSDCETLRTISSIVRGPVSTACRLPRNPLEREVMSRIGPSSSVRACLLATAPAPRLAGFSCLDFEVDGNRRLSCFAPIDSRAIENYHETYSPEIGYRYKAAAAACPITNGDADEAPRSVFPQSLGPVAKPEFGFVVGIGNTRQPLGLAFHGFASIDPRFGADGTALEIVDIFHNTSSEAAAAGTTNSRLTIGPWSVSIDDATKPASDLAQSIERMTGMNARAKIRLMEFKLTAGADGPTGSKKDNLAMLLESVVGDLEEKGFREPTQAEMRNMPQNPQEQILGSVPYSQRDSLQRSMGKFSLMISDDDNGCGKSVSLMTILPASGVKNDFGGFGLNIIVFGPCREFGGAERTAADLLRRETRILTDKLSEL